MTIEELIIYGKERVHSDHAKMLLADLLGKNSLELLTCLNEKISTEIVDIYKKKLEELQEKKPIQYVIGTVNFFGYTFKINKDVLIPRFETEELVENTIKMIDTYLPSAKSVIDLGTGSGAIGITLKKERPNLDVTLLDISEKALEVAKQNATSLKATVQYIKSDMWSDVTKKYDIVISNPPYIKTTETIQEIVKENEPHLALYAGLDGLDCYRKILSTIKDHLNEEYLIAFEIGETQLEDVKSLLTQTLIDAVVISKKDLQGRNRMIFAYHLK